MRFRTCFLLLSLGIARLSWSDATFEPIPKDEQSKYHFDFARNFFSTPEAEKAARSEYDATLADLEKLKGKVTSSAQNLLQALQLFDRATVLFLKHSSYLYLSFVVNTTDRTFSQENSGLSAEFTKRTAFVQTECTQISAETSNQFIKEERRLEPYRFFVEGFARYGPHTLSLKEEELLKAAAPITTEWQFDLYQDIIGGAKFGTVDTKDGTLDVRSQRAAIAPRAERNSREEAFKKLYQGYASRRDLYAFTLIRLAQARNTFAKMRHYDDASAEVYFDSYWTTPEVQDLLQKIMLEQAIHDGVQKGTIREADDLDKQTEQVNSLFSIWGDKHPELKMRWITNSLF